MRESEVFACYPHPQLHLILITSKVAETCVTMCFMLESAKNFRGLPHRPVIKRQEFNFKSLPLVQCMRLREAIAPWIICWSLGCPCGTTTSSYASCGRLSRRASPVTEICSAFPASRARRSPLPCSGECRASGGAQETVCVRMQWTILLEIYFPTSFFQHYWLPDEWGHHKLAWSTMPESKCSSDPIGVLGIVSIVGLNWIRFSCSDDDRVFFCRLQNHLEHWRDLCPNLWHVD